MTWYVCNCDVLFNFLIPISSSIMFSQHDPWLTTLNEDIFGSGCPSITLEIRFEHRTSTLILTRMYLELNHTNFELYCYLFVLIHPEKAKPM